MRYLVLLLALFSSMASAAVGPAPANGGSPGGAAGGGLGGTYPNPTVTLAATDIGYGGGSNTLTGAAGFALNGTPNALAPSAGANGPGASKGLCLMGADGDAQSLLPVSFGNSGTASTAVSGYSLQGTAALPGATTSTEGFYLSLRGHDGTNFAGSQAQIAMRAMSTWSPTNRESSIQFFTTPNASATITAAGRIDSNQTLVMGGGFNSVGTFSAGTLRPHIQTAATGANNAGIAQTIWINSATGPTGILAKSRSTTVGTQGVITTGDTLGTLSWQGDDGTNFISSSQILGVSTGTIGTGQVPGLLRVQTANSAGSLATGYQMDSAQISCFSNGSNLAGQALYTGATVTPRIQVWGNSAALPASIAVAQFQNLAAAGSSIYLAKARGATGTMTVATTGDTLGTIDYQASDGTNFNSAAQIIATVTGTLAAGRTPGNLVFKTGVDAAGSALTTAMTMTNAQVIQENGTTEATSVTAANVVNSGGLGVAKRSFLGTIATTYSGNVIAGVEDGTADVAGAVGEVLTAAQSTPTNFTTTNTIQNLASISLTRGRWLETATMTLAMNGATEVAAAEATCYLDDTTASATGAVEGETIGYVLEPASASSLHATVTIIFQENISAAKTKFFNAKALFTAGNPQYTCSMKAVRIR
jgi:hypothetical protein